ncbi:eisosome protein 1 [Candidatus Bathyarchaeota archaeon]|nr:eisosome protein 1 [Candidatus Bathyarchaeota archaeon]
MKNAEPRSPPSSRANFSDVSASASAAAALGWANQKPLETGTMPQNNMSPSAARAASLAADQRSPPPQKQARNTGALPRTLRSGSPGAGLGSSAAAQAYKTRSPRLAPQYVRKDKPSLLAAKEALGAARPRSISSPVLRRPAQDQASGDGIDPRDEALTQRWEFTPGSGPTGDGAAPATIPSRAVSTANPPVDIEDEKKRKADELRASAVAMTTNMFKKKPNLAESFLPGNDLQRPSEPAQSDQHTKPQAYKLAQGRLANIPDETKKNKELQAHYTPSGALRRRFTVGDRFRGRTSSDSDLEFRRKDRAPNRMTLFGPKQPKSNNADREKELAHVFTTARRNVRSQLDGIDQTVADRTGMVSPSTGMVSPSTKSAWGSRARAVAHGRAAQAAAEEPRDGRRDVGGGLYVAQDDVEAVARRNLKPLFHEIDERAEGKHTRERRAKEERQSREVEAEKKAAYDREVEDLHRKLKGMCRGLLCLGRARLTRWNSGSKGEGEGAAENIERGGAHPEERRESWNEETQKFNCSRPGLGRRTVRSRSDRPAGRRPPQHICKLG